MFKNYLIVIMSSFMVGFYISSTIWRNELLERETRIKNELIEKQTKVVAAKDNTINLLLSKYKQLNLNSNHLNATINRLRISLSEANRKLSSSDSTCKAEKELLSRCHTLLLEGAELSKEGSELLQRSVIAHRALIEFTNDTTAP